KRYEGKEADQYALVQRGRSHPPHSAPRAEPRASHRVHRGRRVRGNHAEIHPPAQESSPSQQAPPSLAGNPRQPGHHLTGQIYFAVVSGPRQNPYCADFSSSSARYCFQTTARVCVPWPRVSSLMGIKTKRAFFTFLISRSAIPSSGGLMKSSAEFMYRSE